MSKKFKNYSVCAWGWVTWSCLICVIVGIKVVNWHKLQWRHLSWRGIDSKLYSLTCILQTIQFLMVEIVDIDMSKRRIVDVIPSSSSIITMILTDSSCAFPTTPLSSRGILTIFRAFFQEGFWLFSFVRVVFKLLFFAHAGQTQTSLFFLEADYRLLTKIRKIFTELSTSS